MFDLHLILNLIRQTRQDPSARPVLKHLASRCSVNKDACALRAQSCDAMALYQATREHVVILVSALRLVRSIREGSPDVSGLTVFVARLSYGSRGWKTEHGYRRAVESYRAIPTVLRKMAKIYVPKGIVSAE